MPALTGPASHWRDDVRRIEELGFDSVSVSDHLTGGWSMDPVVAMTVAAEATSRLRVLALVGSATTGGGGRRVLGLAGRFADIVGINPRRAAGVNSRDGRPARRVLTGGAARSGEPARRHRP